MAFSVGGDILYLLLKPVILGTVGLLCREICS
jgi:hypothetical protein